MCTQPVGERLRSPVGQHIHDPAGLDVDQDSAVGAALAEGKLVHPEHPRRTIGNRRWFEEAEQLAAARRQVQLTAEPFARSPSELGGDGPQPLPGAETGALVTLTQSLDLFDEGLPPTPCPLTEEAPHTQPDLQLLASQRPLCEAALVAGVHPPGSGLATGTSRRRTACHRGHRQHVRSEHHLVQPHVHPREQHIIQRADPHTEEIPCRIVPALLR